MSSVVPLSVLMPTLASRGELRERAVASVATQTVTAVAFDIAVDLTWRGNGALLRTQLVERAQTDWVAFLDDDDEWSPRHLEVGWNTVQATGADVVVASIDWGDSPQAAPHRCDYGALAFANWFPPSAVLARRDMVLDAGGFPEPDPPLWDDWACWCAMLIRGAQFACTHQTTVHKGTHAGNINREVS